MAIDTNAMDPSENCAHPELAANHRVNGDVETISRGPWERIQADADRIVSLARGRENVCLGTGALPYETPPENVLRLREYVSQF